MKVYRHKFMRKYPIIMVEDFSKWANGKIKSDTHYQKVKFKGRPLSYVVIETKNAPKTDGHVDASFIGFTMAMVGGHDKYPVAGNEKLALTWAIRKTMEFEDKDSYEILKSIYENFFGQCPHILENTTAYWHKAFQMDNQGDDEDPDGWSSLITQMDDEIGGSEDFEAEEPDTVDEGVLHEAPKMRKSQQDTKTAKPAQKGKKQAGGTTKVGGEKVGKNKRQVADQDPTKGYTHVRGGEGNLYIKGEKNTDQAQKIASNKGADAKLVNGKMLPLTAQEKMSSTGKGVKDAKNQKAGKGQPQGDQQQAEPSTVKVVDVGSEEYKTAKAQTDGVKRKASTKTAETSSAQTELAVPYAGDKDKSVDVKVAKEVGKSESFTRDNNKSDADFAEANDGHWLSDEHRLTLDHSAFDGTAVAKTSLKVLERMINTNRGGSSAPVGELATAAHYNGDAGGAGQAMSQAGELMMLTFMSVNNDEIDDFYETIESFIDENEDRSVLTKDWLVAAKKNRDVTYKHLDAKYGENNWEVQASGWDTREEFEAMYGTNYEKNKGFSTDAFFTIATGGKAEMLEVSLKKDLGIFFLNSGPQYFMEVDPSLAGGDLDVNVHAQKEKERTKKAFSKAMAKEADKLLKSKPSTKVAKELQQTMKSLNIKSVSELELNFNDQKHRKLAYKAMGMLAEAGNKKAKKLIDETEQAYKDFSDNGIKEIQNNKKLNEGIMGRIREEFPLKSIAGSEEIMALGDQIIDRATMKEMFGTNDADKIMESLKVYKDDNGEAFLGYAAGQATEPIPVAKIRLRPAGVGYTGRVKFDFEMHKKFKSVIQSSNKKIYGGADAKS